MIVYSDRIHNSAIRMGGYEFEILNELKDLSSRTDSNCLKHTRFLFEFDDKPLKEQLELMKNELGEKCVRVVFSGSKSLHFIAQFSDDCEEMCSKHYRRIWQYLEENYFKGADAQCKNPSRLTRAPGALRADTQRVQKLLMDHPSNYIDEAVPELLDRLSVAQRDWIREEKEEEESRDRYRIKSKFLEKRDHNGMCREYKNVKRYLSTPFTKIRGNGNSATWFYAALCTCIQFNDNQTLEEVKDKARRERWSQHEIDHTEANARHAVRMKTGQ